MFIMINTENEKFYNLVFDKWTYGYHAGLDNNGEQSGKLMQTKFPSLTEKCNKSVQFACYLLSTAKFTDFFRIFPDILQFSRPF